jgi:hypothetical protein
MTDNWLSLTSISDQCAQDVYKALGVTSLPEQKGDGALFGVDCKIETVGLKAGSDLLIVCACPKDNDWNFGTCVPLLPGEWYKGNTLKQFNLRFLGLKNALWTYVWAKGDQFNAIEVALDEIGLFKDWRKNPLTHKSVDDLGLLETDLQAVPRPSNQITVGGQRFGGPKADENKARDALFMWGKLDEPLGVALKQFKAYYAEDESQVSEDEAVHDMPHAIKDRLGDMAKFLGNLDKYSFVKVKTIYAQPDVGVQLTSGIARHLQVQLPPHSGTFGHAPIQIHDAALTFSAPIYYSPHSTQIGLKGDLTVGNANIHVELYYPIDGELITAKGKFLGSPEHLLEGKDALGLPEPKPEFRSDTEIEVDLEFSKYDKKLNKLSFDLELHNKHWTLVPEPIALVLEGVSFRVTIYNPTVKKSRMITAELSAEAAFGESSDGDASLRLICGGSYPSADLFLQAKNEIPVGKLLEKLLGPNEGLDKLTIANLRLEYNYRSGQMGMMFDVPEQWEVVHGFKISEISFRLQGRGAFSGGLAAKIQIGQLSLYLTGLYDQAWQVEGNTEPGKEIHIDDLLKDLAHKFGADTNGCAALEGKSLKDLHIYFNTGSKDFIFSGEVDLDMEGTTLKTVVSITIKHLNDGSVSKTFSGVIHFEVGKGEKAVTHEFDVVFDKRDIKLANNPKEDISTLIAGYRADPNHPLAIKNLVPEEYKNFAPPIDVLGAFIAHQSSKSSGVPKKKWLLGLSLDAGIDLSNVKLPKIPMMGAGGPPKSLKLELQVLVSTGKGVFEPEELAVIGGLNATGNVSVPARMREASAVACTILMDGMTVALDLPIKASKNKNKPFVHDEEAANPSQPPVLPGAPHAVAVTPHDNTKWVKIQKNFGPIHIERIGLKYQPTGSLLFIYLDGSLTAGSLTLSLMGLGVDTPLTEFDPHFHISGIGIEYKGGDVELGGAFLRQQIPDPDPNSKKTITAYAGEAVLRTETLALSAIGSYFKYKGDSSLFIYALLEYPLGGPPFFFVTGLACGFGYNRRAIVPQVEQVHTYPLVSRAIAGPQANKGAKPNLAAELASLEAYIPPELGEMFLAVGVKFSSFELVASFALVIAQFGEQSQFDLVGVSHLQIPSKAAGGQPGSLLAEIYMNWKAYFRPDEGVVGLKASLAPGSYILSQDCHLRGDFAYFAWFGGEHAGDFVYTLGGYHPDFKKPPHYPDAKRLAFNWVLSAANLNLKGEVYYALTGHAFMAGGALDATIEGGFDIGIAGIDFRADLHIGADFMITWQPFHYDGKVNLDLKIDISAHLFFCSKHFSLDVGGDMHLWGPEFAGEAKIYLKVWVIRHTLDVKFGHGPPQLRPINWDKFHLAFLPKTKTDPAKSKAIAKVDEHAVCGVSVKSGLIKTSGERWVMNAKEFCLVTDSAIPITDAQCGDSPALLRGAFFSDGHGEGAHLVTEVERDFGIASMGVTADGLTTTHHIEIKLDEKDNVEELFRCEPVLKQLPAAIWEQPDFVEGSNEEFLQKPKTNPDRLLISKVLCGVKIYPAILLKEHKTFSVERGELLYEVGKPIIGAYQWEDIPSFKSRASIPTANRPADEKKNITTYHDILKELGLQNDAVRPIYPASDWLDSPQIEQV